MSKCPNEGQPCYCTGACRGEKPGNSRYMMQPKVIGHNDGAGVSLESIKSAIRGDLVNRGAKMRGRETINGTTLKVDREALNKVLSGHQERQSGCLWDSVPSHDANGVPVAYSMSCNCPKCSVRC